MNCFHFPENCQVSPATESELEKDKKATNVGTYSLNSDITGVTSLAKSLNGDDLIYVPVGYHLDITCASGSTPVQHDADTQRTGKI